MAYAFSGCCATRVIAVGCPGRYGPTLLAMVLALWAPSALADGLEHRLVFQAPEDCPSREALLGEVSARLAPGTAHDVEDAHSELNVQIEREGAAFVGILRVGTEPPRRLEGDRCDEVVHALGIVIASQIGRERSTSEQPRSVPQQNSPRPQASAGFPTVAPPLAPLSEARPPATATQTRLPPPRPVLEPGRPNRFWGLGAGGTVLGAVAPRVAWGPLIGAEFGSSQRFGWSLRMTAERAFTGTFAAAPARASFTLTALRGSGCLLLGTAVRGSGCIEAGYGQLQATGVATGPIVEARTIRVPWVSLGPSLGIEIGLGNRLDFSVEAALPIALWHEKLIYQTPDATVHKTQPVTVRIAAMLKARWGGSKTPNRSIAP